MTEGQFVKNNTNVGDFPDMPAEFLIELYNKIKDNEIKMNDGLFLFYFFFILFFFCFLFYFFVLFFFVLFLFLFLFILFVCFNILFEYPFSFHTKTKPPNKKTKKGKGSISGSQKHGWLHRRSRRKNWKRQYFVLRDKYLYAFRAEDDAVFLFFSYLFVCC